MDETEYQKKVYEIERKSESSYHKKIVPIILLLSFLCGAPIIKTCNRSVCVEKKYRTQTVEQYINTCDALNSLEKGVSEISKTDGFPKEDMSYLVKITGELKKDSAKIAETSQVKKYLKETEVADMNYRINMLLGLAGMAAGIAVIGTALSDYTCKRKKKELAKLKEEYKASGN